MAFALGCLTLTACASPADLGSADPLTVTPPSSPNWALAAPEGVARVAAAEIVTPPFAASPDQVAAALVAVAAAEPRTERTDDGADPTALGFVQRSRLFRFPDVISARVLDLGPGRASAALYSRSVYGYSDLGVNRARLERWVEALGRRLPPAP